VGGAEVIEVRYGRHDGRHGACSESFDTFEDANDFADWVRQEMGDTYWVEFDEIAAFAQAIEEAAKKAAFKAPDLGRHLYRQEYE
jgi:hypothetical protein